jgi:hypothetical protein
MQLFWTEYASFYGLNMKCPPQDHEVKPKTLVGGTIWEVLETLGSKV